MMRAATILAVTAAGALVASAPARADEVSLADRILNAVYGDLGMSALADDQPIAERNGFFVGVHSGLGAESGVSPLAAGLSVPLNTDDVESITANAYYTYTTDWSLGVYGGAGFGKFNLSQDPLLKEQQGLPKGTFAYQAIGGLTYSLSPSMALGVEYRYSEQVNNPLLTQNTLPSDQEKDQSVTLRFDFLLN